MKSLSDSLTQNYDNFMTHSRPCFLDQKHTHHITHHITHHSSLRPADSREKRLWQSSNVSTKEPKDEEEPLFRSLLPSYFRISTWNSPGSWINFSLRLSKAFQICLWLSSCDSELQPTMPVLPQANWQRWTSYYAQPGRPPDLTS